MQYLYSGEKALANYAGIILVPSSIGAYAGMIEIESEFLVRSLRFSTQSSFFVLNLILFEGLVNTLRTVTPWLSWLYNSTIIIRHTYYTHNTVQLAGKY